MEKALRLTLLVYEPDEQKRAVIRSALRAFAARRDMDLRVDWMFRAEQEEQLPRIMPDTMIALVNAGMGERSVIAGRRIYDANPDCLLVYYGKPEPDLMPLLPARPVAYDPAPDSEGLWEEILQGLTDRIAAANGYFHWSGKDRQYRLPYRSILHIRSERVYLDVFTAGGVYRMVGKLDAAAKRLPCPPFLRVHQSELVNTRHVPVLDRSRRCLILDDGSEIYISRARYQDVLEWFEKRSEESIIRKEEGGAIYEKNGI